MCDASNAGPIIKLKQVGSGEEEASLIPCKIRPVDALSLSLTYLEDHASLVSNQNQVRPVKLENIQPSGLSEAQFFDLLCPFVYEEECIKLIIPQNQESLKVGSNSIMFRIVQSARPPFDKISYKKGSKATDNPISPK